MKLENPAGFWINSIFGDVKQSFKEKGPVPSQFRPTRHAGLPFLVPLSVRFLSIAIGHRRSRSQRRRAMQTTLDLQGMHCEVQRNFLRGTATEHVRLFRRKVRDIILVPSSSANNGMPVFLLALRGMLIV